MDNRLQAKDLINVGIFTAIYFVLFFATGMIGYIPILMLALPAVCPLVTGIPFMLFLTRIRKFGMVTIMGTIIGILFTLTGHPITIVPIAFGFSLLGDFILKAGGYKTWAFVRLGYIVFSEWLAGLMVPIFFMRDSYFPTIRDGYGDAYADALASITPPWMFFVMIGMVALGALFGAYVGKSVLKRHFKRAGIA